jgi:hypothetical protein
VDFSGPEACWLVLKNANNSLIDLAELSATIRRNSSDFKPLAGRLLPIVSRETL